MEGEGVQYTGKDGRALRNRIGGVGLLHDRKALAKTGPRGTDQFDPVLRSNGSGGSDNVRDLSRATTTQGGCGGPNPGGAGFGCGGGGSGGSSAGGGAGKQRGSGGGQASGRGGGEGKGSGRGEKNGGIKMAERWDDLRAGRDWPGRGLAWIDSRHLLKNIVCCFRPTNIRTKTWRWRNGDKTCKR